MKKVASLILIAALLSACAPAIRGGSLYTPTAVESNFSFLRVQPGHGVYATYKLSPSLLKVSEARFKAANIGFVDNGGTYGVTTSQEKSADWIKLVQADLPQGVHAELVKAYLMNDIAETHDQGTSTSISYYRRVHVILHVTADAGAPLNKDYGTLTFEGDGQQSVVPIGLEISR